MSSKTKLTSPKRIKDNEHVHYGKCKWFNVAKGWGFITPNDGGPEVFVHQSVIQMTGFRSLGEQEEVEYEVKETERGMEATRVSGRNGVDCAGLSLGNLSKRKLKRRRLRCYNCGQFANHIAANCELGPQPKLCHYCKKDDHLVIDCPEKKVRDVDNKLKRIKPEEDFKAEDPKEDESVENNEKVDSHSKHCAIA